MNKSINLVGRVGFGATLILALALALAPSALAGGYSITGTVKRVSGQPISSVWVVLRQGEVEKGRSLSGDDGKYYISGLTEGPYDLVVLRGQNSLAVGRVHLPEARVFNIILP